MSSTSKIRKVDFLCRNIDLKLGNFYDTLVCSFFVPKERKIHVCRKALSLQGVYWRLIWYLQILDTIEKFKLGKEVSWVFWIMKIKFHCNNSLASLDTFFYLPTLDKTSIWHAPKTSSYCALWSLFNGVHWWSKQNWHKKW